MAMCLAIVALVGFEATITRQYEFNIWILTMFSDLSKETVAFHRTNMRLEKTAVSSVLNKISLKLKLVGKGKYVASSNNFALIV